MLGALSPSEEEGARIYKELGRPMKGEKIRELSEEKRRFVVDFLRRSAEDAKRPDDPQSVHVSQQLILDMAILGDDQAIVQSVNYFLAKGTRAVPNQMLLLNSPKAIPLMGEALFKDENFELRGDVGHIPTQTTVSNVILHTLSNSPSFNEGVVNWAQRVKQGYTIKMMRDWYRQNEAKLKAWDFKAVQPGAELPESKQDASAETQAPSEPPPAPVPSASLSKTPERPVTPAGSSVRDLSIGAILLAICGILIWLMARKAK